MNFTPNDSSGKPLLKLTRSNTLKAGCSWRFRIVENGQHDIWHIAVFPISHAPRGVNAGGADGTGHSVKASEKMNEEIAGDTGAVVAEVAPAEETGRVPFALGCVAEELRPVAGGKAGVGGNGIFPSADGGVAVKPSFD